MLKQHLAQNTNTTTKEKKISFCFKEFPNEYCQTEHKMNQNQYARVISVAISGGTGTRNPTFGYTESAEKWVKGKLNKSFLQFLPNNFCHI